MDMRVRLPPGIPISTELNQHGITRLPDYDERVHRTPFATGFYAADTIFLKANGPYQRGEGMRAHTHHVAHALVFVRGVADFHLISPDGTHTVERIARVGAVRSVPAEHEHWQVAIEDGMESYCVFSKPAQEALLADPALNENWNKPKLGVNNG